MKLIDFLSEERLKVIRPAMVKLERQLQQEHSFNYDHPQFTNGVSTDGPMMGGMFSFFFLGKFDNS